MFPMSEVPLYPWDPADILEIQKMDMCEGSCASLKSEAGHNTVVKSWPVHGYLAHKKQLPPSRTTI